MHLVNNKLNLIKLLIYFLELNCFSQINDILNKSSDRYYRYDKK